MTEFTLTLAIEAESYGAAKDLGETLAGQAKGQLIEIEPGEPDETPTPRSLPGVTGEVP